MKVGPVPFSGPVPFFGPAQSTDGRWVGEKAETEYNRVLVMSCCVLSVQKAVKDLRKYPMK